LLQCGVPPRIPVPLAVLASGFGGNFEALTLASRTDGFPASIELLVCDDPECPALERARRLGVPSLTLPVGRFRTRIEDESVWVHALRSRGIEGLLLAGFMRRLHAPLLAAFPDRILNVHPSLLPAFPGRDAIARAWAAGVRELGCTVHVVREEVDGGPVIDRAIVERRDGESLARLTERIHEAEHRLYPEAVRRWFGAPAASGCGSDAGETHGARGLGAPHA
jgi:phosphoribosylglycinamide formyltransferase-1